MTNQHMQAAVEEAYSWLRYPFITSDQRSYVLRYIGLLEAAATLYEDHIFQAMNIGVRNPEFPGDFVGRPDDDFADYYGLDEEDDER